MNSNPAIEKILDFPPREPGQQWALATSDELTGGDLLIASIPDDSAIEVAGRFSAQTGNVVASGEAEDSENPAVLCIGDPAGMTGQLKARQAKGNYLRVCRWDRLVGDQVPAIQPTATFRTLPQCGCGGYLGTPQFFDTFAEMSAYVFCNFFE